MVQHFNRLKHHRFYSGGVRMRETILNDPPLVDSGPSFVTPRERPIAPLIAVARGDGNCDALHDPPARTDM